MTGRAPMPKVMTVPARRILRHTLISAGKGLLWNIPVSFVIAFFVWFFVTLVAGAGIPFLVAWRWAYIGFAIMVIGVEILILIQIRSLARKRKASYSLMWESRIIHHFHRDKFKKELEGRDLIAQVETERSKLRRSGKVPRAIRSLHRIPIEG